MSQDTVSNSVDTAAGNRSWREALGAFLHPRVITMLFLGFSAGVPILLIFSSLSLWLREAGVERSTVTLFSWAALGYSFKFVWAPLVDRLPLPVLTRWLGRRRSWMLLSQFAVIGSILWMAATNPAAGGSALAVMAMAAVALGFASATQDIVIDAYRIESAGSELQALMSSSYIGGYRIGMIIAGAGALYLADLFGTRAEAYSYVAWSNTYRLMALAMLIGIATTLLIREPDHYRELDERHSTEDHIRFLLLFLLAVAAFIVVYRVSSAPVATLKTAIGELSGNSRLGALAGESVKLFSAVALAALVAWSLVRVGLANRQMVFSAYAEPVLNFFRRYGTSLAILLLLVIGFYRVSDLVLGAIANVFYQDMGFSKSDIATVSKVFGLWMTLLGSFLGGLMAVRFGVMRILMLGAILSAATNLLFMLLADNGGNLSMLYLVIAADNLSAGLAQAAFIAFLSALTDVRFTAMQYAIFSSLMTLAPKTLGGYSGAMAESLGYGSFFLLTAVLTVPVVVVLWIVSGRVKLDQARPAG